MRLGGLVLCSVLLMLPALMRAQEIAPAANWWAGVGVEGGASLHRFEGDVSSSDIAAPPIDNTQPIRPPDSGSSDYVTPFVAGSLELAGPAWLGVRPFVSASIGGQFGVERDVAKEGTAESFSFPFTTVSPDTDAQEALVRGQGSETTVQTATFFFGAGVGAAFGLEVGGRAVRVKPSFRYLWEEIEAEGVVQRAVLLQDAADMQPTSLDDFRLISLTKKETQAFHAVGPGLEVDVDLTRRGEWVMSVFASGGADFFVGDREIQFSATNEMGERADFRVELDPVSYRAAVGLRVRLER